MFNDYFIYCKFPADNDEILKIAQYSAEIRTRVCVGVFVTQCICIHVLMGTAAYGKNRCMFMLDVLCENCIPS